MQTFLDSELSWLRSKSVAYSRLYLGMTLVHCLSEIPGTLRFLCALSSRRSGYFSHLCEAAQIFMESHCLAQKQAHRLLEVILGKESVYISLLFCKYHALFIAVWRKWMFFLILLEFQVVFFILMRTRSLVPETHFFCLFFWFSIDFSWAWRENTLQT